MFALASVASAGITTSNGGSGGFLRNWGSGGLKSYVSPDLLSAIQQNPRQQFDVILEGGRGVTAHGFVQRLLGARGDGTSIGSAAVRQEFQAVSGAQLTLSGLQILFLAKLGLAQSIVANETVHLQGLVSDWLPNFNTQLWPWATGAPVDWVNGAPKAATIAVVDSGVQSRPDFGSRLLGQVNMTSLAGNSAGDGYGHGTFVAGIAAGSGKTFAGAAPNANILSIDVMDDQGEATVGDILKACDWILANKTTYNIKVVNMSLHAVSRASVLFDPLDQAVEKLWLNGITVVAAAGNYGNGTPVGVQFAPGNDPFVITVGAADIGTSVSGGDDTAAPWSAYGYTPDGFWKPDIAAPGRYMIGPVPGGSTLTKEKPQNVTDSSTYGYMQLSGTSFAAPVVSAAAAMLVTQHPTWTPDQIKGALMVTATPELKAGSALGVGDVNIARARMYSKNPPNPNAGIDKYLKTAADGTKTFDATSWQQAALSNKAWDAAAWSDVAWSDAAWSDAAWASAAWADAAWASAAWASAAWSDAAWSDAAWSDAAWADNANDDPSSGDPVASTDQQSAALADLGITDGTCDPTQQICSSLTTP